MSKFVIRIVKEAYVEVEAASEQEAIQLAAAIEADGLAEFDMAMSVTEEIA